MHTQRVLLFYKQDVMSRFGGSSVHTHTQAAQCARSAKIYLENEPSPIGKAAWDRNEGKQIKDQLVKSKMRPTRYFSFD